LDFSVLVIIDWRQYGHTQGTGCLPVGDIIGIGWDCWIGGFILCLSWWTINDDGGTSFPSSI
jgi:hypothetical protein